MRETWSKRSPLRDIYTGGHFILADRANLLAYGFGRPDASGGTGFRDIPWDIFEITADGTSQKIGSFPIPVYSKVEAGGAISWTGWNQLQVVALDSNSLFLNSTSEYLIEEFVRDKRAVVLRFRRPYARVKWSGGGGVSVSRGNEPPRPSSGLISMLYTLSTGIFGSRPRPSRKKMAPSSMSSTRMGVIWTAFISNPR